MKMYILFYNRTFPDCSSMTCSTWSTTADYYKWHGLSKSWTNKKNNMTWMRKTNITLEFAFEFIVKTSNSQTAAIPWCQTGGDGLLKWEPSINASDNLSTLPMLWKTLERSRIFKTMGNSSQLLRSTQIQYTLKQRKKPMKTVIM